MESSMHIPDPFETSTVAESAAPGVRRVNNMPILIAVAVLVAVVLIAVSVAYDRAGEVSKQVPESIVADQGLADQVLSASGGRTGGLVDAPDRSPLPSLPLAPVVESDLPPLPPSSAPEQDLAATKLRAGRLQMLQNAIAARTSAVAQPVGAGRVRDNDVAPLPSSQRPRGLDQDAELSAPSRQPEAEGRAGADGPDGSRSRTPASYGQFDRRNQADRWRLEARADPPRSPFELRAGFVIPAILLSGIDSDLPGQIVAQVSQDVYDTPSGRHRLIPQGTRLVGTYDSNVAYGQRRVLIAWQRLVFPDGKAMDIGSMPGVDAAGYAGFKDKADNHYLRIFGSALLMSGVIAGISSAQTDPSDDPYGTSTSTVMLQAIAQQVGRVAAEMIQRNLNISPTLKIRPGFRFNVMTVKDLSFDKPYQPFDY